MKKLKSKKKQKVVENSSNLREKILISSEKFGDF